MLLYSKPGINIFNNPVPGIKIFVHASCSVLYFLGLAPKHDFLSLYLIALESRSRQIVWKYLERVCVYIYIVIYIVHIYVKIIRKIEKCVQKCSLPKYAQGPLIKHILGT